MIITAGEMMAVCPNCHAVFVVQDRKVEVAAPVKVELADNFPDKEGYQTYLDWERIIGYPQKIAEDDKGRNITFARLVVRRLMT